MQEAFLYQNSSGATPERQLVAEKKTGWAARKRNGDHNTGSLF